MGRLKPIVPWKPNKEEEDSYYVPVIPARNRRNLDSLYEDGLVCKTKKDASKLYDALIAYARTYQGFL